MIRSHFPSVLRSSKEQLSGKYYATLHYHYRLCYIARIKHFYPEFVIEVYQQLFIWDKATKRARERERASTGVGW